MQLAQAMGCDQQSQMLTSITMLMAMVVVRTSITMGLPLVLMNMIVTAAILLLLQY